MPSEVPPVKTLKLFDAPFPTAVVVTLGVFLTTTALRLFPDESTQTLEVAL